MKPKSDQELVDAYLASGKTITICPCVDEVVGPYEGKLQRTTTPIVKNNNGDRVYQHLDKFRINTPIDESTLNYGKDC